MAVECLEVYLACFSARKLVAFEEAWGRDALETLSSQLALLEEIL